MLEPPDPRQPRDDPPARRPFGLGAHRILAVVATVALATAVAAGPAAGRSARRTSRSTTISAALSAPSVRVGWPVVVRGRVVPADATPLVVVQRAVDRRWADRASGPVAADGTYAVVVTPSQTGTYSLRVRSAGGTVASRRLTLAVTPAPTLSIAASATATSIGSPVTLSGRVTPASATPRVVSQRLVAGRWVDRDGAAVDPTTGAFTITVHPGDKATYLLRVRSRGGSVVSATVAVSTSYKAFTMVDTGDARPGERVVALTFDDGPSATYTPQVLAVLARDGVRATFFDVGEEVQAHPDLVRQEVRAGDRVGSHSYDHPDLTRLSDAAVRSELGRTDDLLRAEGVASRCIRPPYGAQDLRVQQLIAEWHSSTLLWDVAPDDWARPGTSAIVSRVLAHLHPGAIIGLHDGGGDRAETVAAIAQLIPAIEARGYQIRPIC